MYILKSYHGSEDRLPKFRGAFSVPNGVKGYLRYKTITPKNVLSEAQFQNFLFCRKIMFCSQDIQVFLFLVIPRFSKSVT